MKIATTIDDYRNVAQSVGVVSDAPLYIDKGGKLASKGFGNRSVQQGFGSSERRMAESQLVIDNFISVLRNNYGERVSQLAELELTNSKTLSSRNVLKILSWVENSTNSGDGHMKKLVYDGINEIPSGPRYDDLFLILSQRPGFERNAYLYRLSNEEMVSVYFCTTETGSRHVNNLLRSAVEAAAGQNDRPKKRLWSVLSSALNGMRKLPNHVGPSYQLLDEFPDGVLASYRPGTRIRSPSFVSASEESSLIDPANRQEKACAAFRISSKRGKNIRDLASERAPAIFFKPDTVFEITRITGDEDGAGVEVDMAEVADERI